MLTSDSFLAQVEAFLKSGGVKRSVFGREAVGDPNFVADLRNGRKPSLRLVEKVDAYIKARRAQKAALR